ncbi:hypothetical protein MMC10_002609 [Thelotrema lepadinum]|nr:hypothetical protein [Thelotrema lepadinum]
MSAARVTQAARQRVCVTALRTARLKGRLVPPSPGPTTARQYAITVLLSPQKTQSPALNLLANVFVSLREVSNAPTFRRNGQVISTETGPTAPTSTSMASNSDALATSPPLATPTASPNTLSASTINPPYIVPNTSYTPASLAGLILIILTLVGLTISQIILYVKVRRNKKATQTKLEVLLRRVGDEYYFGARAAGGPKGGRGTGVVQMKDSRTLREMRGSGRPAELESPEIG